MSSKEKYNKPPVFAEFLMRQFFPDSGSYTTLGDLAEVYQIIFKEKGRLRAYAWYWLQIVNIFIPLIKDTLFWGGIMFQNYILSALRNLKKHKTFSLISLWGIAVSFAACLFIIQYISFEVSYDNFHENKKYIFRLTNDRYQNDKLIQHGIITYPSVAKQIKADIPEVINYTRLIQYSKMITQVEDEIFEEEYLFADSAFLSMFSFPLLKGNFSKALAEPYSLLLSASKAEKYFGENWNEKNILGKLVNVDKSYDLKITGVFEDIPENSHMKFDMLVSYSTLGKQYDPGNEDSWNNSNFMTYLQLQPGTNKTDVETKFNVFTEKYFQGATVTGYIEKFYLQPLPDIHLYSDYEYETWVHGNSAVVDVLIIIAGLIMIIAWVNYINLSTANSLTRAKEVGVRKVLGAHKNQLLNQFLAESALMNICGIILSIVILFILQDDICELFNLKLSSSVLSNKYGVIFISFLLTGVFISGFYPAFMVSSFNSVEIMTGKLKNSSKGQLIRKGLVVFQFLLSIIILGATFAVYSQIDFMIKKDLGIDIERTLVVEGPIIARFDSTFMQKIDEIKTEFKSLAAVHKAATSRRLPGRGTGRIFNIQLQGEKSDSKFTAGDISVDYNFFDTFGLRVIAGRGFLQTDHNSNFNYVNNVVINEAAVRMFGFNDAGDICQKRLKFWGKEWTIVGVVENHHQQSLHVPIMPYVFTPFYSTGSYYFLKINEQNVAEAIPQIESIYKSFFPNNIFKYFFLDEFFNRQYQADINFKKILSAFAILGIFLAALGLFGLSFFTTAQRTKEIGIRKIVGASSLKIVNMLLWDFLKLVILSAILAIPVSYFVITKWLESYPYKIELNSLIFLFPILIVLLIAVITIVIQTLKAANSNPVTTLKYD